MADREKSNADLDRVTDYVEDKDANTEQYRASMNTILDKDSVANQQKIQKEKELAAVSIKEEDVDLIVQEMELDKKVAERTLREHKGDVEAALTALINS